MDTGPPLPHDGGQEAGWSDIPRNLQRDPGPALAAQGSPKAVATERQLAQGRQCPLNVLLSQLGPQLPGAQAITTELMRQWQAGITAGVRAMQAVGEVDRPWTPTARRPPCSPVSRAAYQ